jgi:predicted nuclease with TOPRIM domain
VSNVTEGIRAISLQEIDRKIREKQALFSDAQKHLEGIDREFHSWQQRLIQIRGELGLLNELREELTAPGKPARKLSEKPVKEG